MSRTEESVTVDIARTPDCAEKCVLEFSFGSSVAVRATAGSIGVTVHYGPTLFDATCRFREYLESKGYRLLCSLARRDAYPSRMSQQMGGGRKVYILKAGRQAKRRDLVDAFQFAEFEAIATVAEQRAAYDEWIGSLG